MGFVTRVVSLPFTVFKCPNMKLKVPEIAAPSAMTVFFLLFASYFLVCSGIIYDIIVEPPSIGSTQEGGAVKPIAFLQRINGQFIIEGLSAGFLFVLGGMGFIILDGANKKLLSERNRFLLILTGVIFIVAAYNLLVLFIRMKVPGYLQ
eukprot:TRINITY_DN877_c0_g1_i2.p1 TRINITY_DN877_c0_g1~~TRINITY_DN877_c0_g1_i2.p1  ORF type:complete len:169 (-),score=51.41 TRINITY_DN877_c0_g1_i2:74-520(-)